MNDTFREVKDRIRKLDEVLVKGGSSNLELAQALSRVRRLVKHGDRSREPSSEIKVSLDRAEAIGRLVIAG
jgi:hypothetical protein